MASSTNEVPSSLSRPALRPKRRTRKKGRQALLTRIFMNRPPDAATIWNLQSAAPYLLRNLLRPRALYYASFNRFKKRFQETFDFPPASAVGNALSFCRGIPGVQLLAGKLQRTSPFPLYDGKNGRVRRSGIPFGSLAGVTPASR